ncbi:serine hydroxymethyltransferase [Paralcaligenes ureilyticus]|uniref:Glycine hydroxymethyltransferase n=1 Tax=Paralcaligenes ureilyticus TaxID=627131 RepID=A0A4R3M6H8_9BURK|nr:aminotransferase class I/II-fold pyridoxal phosphate-dependent enzyme [Paralcaligenes ureilyticus]TCT08672.1 glycine hydroxymethyltransferase [Paralcaligenes ureilyticus]
MSMLASRDWVPEKTEQFIQSISHRASTMPVDEVDQQISSLIKKNRKIHEQDCFNLNPATNVVNPKVEAVLAQGLGSRPSLGYPGDKYEMGLEAIEEIEVFAAELAAEIFNARYAEIRVGSGALANLYAFMATTKPGDAIIVPPPSIGGHVTHHPAGAAGLYGLQVHSAPVDSTRYTVDVDRLRADALRLRPKLITIGGSLNLFSHPIKEIRQIADEIGAIVLFDAAHMSGMIAGRAWQQPLQEGAHLMTMSTYKSLGGHAGGLIVTNDADIAKKIDAIAYPGLTANFDASKAAALAMALLDWKVYGQSYASMMAQTAKALAGALYKNDIPVFAADRGFTTSHQFAVEAAAYGGGQAAAKKLRQINVLTCGIGLPMAAVEGDVNGLRFGTPEAVRFGMQPEDMGPLAELISQGLKANSGLDALAKKVSQYRRNFTELHFIRT